MNFPIFKDQLPLLRFLFITVFALVLAASCRKKQDEPAPVTQPPPATTPSDTAYACGSLPPPPEPFGWADSTFDENQNVNAFFRNPVQTEELVVVVNGDAFGYNKLYAYNLRLKQSKYLATLDRYLPDINSGGWIVYSSVDKNIYKVKANGDSTTQLTTLHLASDAKWDHTGKNIYFFQDATVFAESQLLKIDASGKVLTGFPIDMPLTAVCRKSNKILLQKLSTSQVTLMMKDMTTQAETPILTDTYDRAAKKTPYDFLTFDQEDEYIYWNNDKGIFRYHLASKRMDTVFRNCPNAIHLRPMMSRVAREMTFSRHVIKPTGPFVLLHQYLCYEYDFTSNKVRELKIFY